MKPPRPAAKMSFSAALQIRMIILKHRLYHVLTGQCATHSMLTVVLKSRTRTQVQTTDWFKLASLGKQGLM